MTKKENTLSKITMEDLREPGAGLLYLDRMLDAIRDLTIVINDVNNICFTTEISTVRVYCRSTVDACYKERSDLLAELGARYLLGCYDDDVREYINDRLKEIAEKNID